MPRNGSGTFNRTNGVNNGPAIWQDDEATIGFLDAPRHDTEGNDYATGLTDSLAKDGQTVPTANLPMGSFKHTSVANGTARDQYAGLGQLQDGQAVWVIATGTGDAMVGNHTPVITAVVDGQQIRIRTPDANTVTTPTYQEGATTARVIVKAGGAPLIAGDYVADMEIILRYKDLGTPVYELLTPVQADTSTFVPSTRLVDTDNTSLTGGGDLSADRTIAAILADQAEAEAGTDNEKLITSLRVAQAITAQATTGITVGAVLTIDPYNLASSNVLAHSLPAEPNLINWVLECTAINGGYQVGDRVDGSSFGTQGSVSNAGFQILKDATNITVAIGTTAPRLIDKTAFTDTGITPASWKLIVTPYLLTP